MAPERWESAIEVALLSNVKDSPSETVPHRLISVLHEQGIEPGTVTSIAESDPARLRSQLAAVLAGPRSAAKPLPAIAVLCADVVVNATPLGAVLDDPRVRTGALAVAGSRHESAEADDDQDRQLHLGVLKVAGDDRAAAAALVSNLPTAAQQPGELLLDLTQALTDTGIDVRPVELGGYAWARPESAEQDSAAVAAVAAVNERTVRLREAARTGDGFYSTFVLRRISWRFTALAERIGLTPNQVTLISFGLGLVAAGFLAVGSRSWSIAGRA